MLKCSVFFFDLISYLIITFLGANSCLKSAFCQKIVVPLKLSFGLSDCTSSYLAVVLVSLVSYLHFARPKGRLSFLSSSTLRTSSLFED